MYRFLYFGLRNGYLYLCSSLASLLVTGVTVNILLASMFTYLATRTALIRNAKAKYLYGL